VIIITAPRKIRRNSEIKAKEVRLLDSDGTQIGIVPLEDAIQRARASDLDLIEVSSTASPPVCKITDFNKYRYELQQKEKQAKKKQKQIQIKEIKLRPGTEEGDYQVKLRKLLEFLEEGDKVKVTLRFRGREVVHQDIGMQLMRRVEGDLSDIGIVESRPRLEGRQMVMMISPNLNRK
jgi:translation initiation factor IF-3